MAGTGAGAGTSQSRSAAQALRQPMLQDKMPSGSQMARPQKTLLSLPQGKEIKAATGMPNLLRSQKCNFLDHPLDQRLTCPSRRLCSPHSLPTSKLPKKPKMQGTGDMFPTDWSPPPVDFLTSRTPPASRRRPAQMWFSGSSEEYINSLDYLLQEKREQALEEEREELLLQDCPNLKALDLNEEDTPLTPEHRVLVERFSVSLQAIPQVHPGETVFLPRQHPLPCILDCSHLKPRNHLEGLFLSSPPAQQLSFLRSGLLSNLYLDTPDCPVPLLQWLFQLLTWPLDTSSRAFDLLWDLSVNKLFLQSDESRPLWCPSLQDVLGAFHGLGTHSPDLYRLAPSHQGRRVLKSEGSLHERKPQDTPWEITLDISLGYICKFLALCVLAWPGTYTDGNILSLIELLCRASLDVGLRLLPNTDLQQLLLLLLENIQEWPGKLQQLCCCLSWMSDHHHNLLALVQSFPDITPRSRQLRSQLSLVVISRLLGQQETLPLWTEKAQLSSLSRLLCLMRPASLRQYLASEVLQPCQEQQPKANAELDRKVCYLCHSLLTLAGVVVSCQDITPDQWGKLQLLCVQLDRHISTHIRESPQAMHRTKLKDLAAQTYIRWQELLAHGQPQAQYFSPWKDI